MILLDSSVPVGYLRAKGADRAKLAGLFVSLRLEVCGAVRTEVISGAKSPADRVRLLNFLGTFSQRPTPEAVWDEHGDIIAILRRAGITVPYSDSLVATLAIHTGTEVWARDKHFPLMQTALPALRLFVEPP